MKKAFLLLITAIGLFVFSEFAYAESWICDNCNTENTGNFCGNCGQKKTTNEWICLNCGTTNSSKFCSNCGKEKPTNTIEMIEKSTITDVSFSWEKGTTIITWKDSANIGPYEVFCTTEEWEGDDSILGGDSYKKPTATIDSLIPEQTYQIIITNGQSITIANYTVPKEAFTDFKSGRKLEIQPDVINSSGDDYYQTIRLTIYYPQLKRDRVYNYLLALKTPKGYCSVVRYSNSFVLSKQYSGIYDDFGINDFLDAIKQNFGEIMRGEYCFEVYFDGAIYASIPIRINP